MKDPLHGKGPIYRTFREIAQLPPEQQFDALIDRLDLLDNDEATKVVVNKGGFEYPATNNGIRAKILDTGKEWLEHAQAAGAKGAGKLAALKMFDGGKKAG